jgi:hypothetical protein
MRLRSASGVTALALVLALLLVLVGPRTALAAASGWLAGTECTGSLANPPNQTQPGKKGDVVFCAGNTTDPSPKLRVMGETWCDVYDGATGIDLDVASSRNGLSRWTSPGGVACDPNITPDTDECSSFVLHAGESVVMAFEAACVDCKVVCGEGDRP